MNTTVFSCVNGVISLHLLNYGGQQDA